MFEFKTMAAKNSVKEFVSDAYYHIYNRGVDKRTIFVDAQDYVVFLSYIQTYLLPKDTKALFALLENSQAREKEKDKARKLLRLNNFAGELTVQAYCLMPNHFHLLVKQREERTIDRFMNSLCVRYAMYFNRKYKRVGVLYQDTYKAVRVTTEEQLLHLTRYIHRNPASQEDLLQDYRHSSYPDYLGLRRTSWVMKGTILDHFSLDEGPNSYRSFVEGHDDRPELLRDISIDMEF